MKNNNYNQLEKPKNEMISSLDEDTCQRSGKLTRRGEEISHFLASFRAGSFGLFSALLVVADALLLHRQTPRALKKDQMNSAQPAIVCILTP